VRGRIVEPAMRKVYALLDRLAGARTPVVLQGETGVGKEIAARFLHERSPRRDRPFVPVNCAAIPEHLAESELFGFERGAFTGATVSRTGLLEAAHGGTIFLDEVGELPVSTQGRLLRAVDGGRVRPIGAKSERSMDVRLVSATNRDLVDEVRAKRFREDLRFRIGAAIVHIPPLRERRGEIPYLALSLLNAERVRMGRTQLQLGAETLARLSAHDWPGNVRELKHLMELVAASTGEDAAELHVDDLPLVPERQDQLCVSDAVSDMRTVRRFQPIEAQMRTLIRSQMVLALEAAEGNQAEAARLLAMSRRTFVMRIKQYEIEVATFRRRSTSRR